MKGLKKSKALSDAVPGYVMVQQTPCAPAKHGAAGDPKFEPQVWLGVNFISELMTAAPSQPKAQSSGAAGPCVTLAG